MSGGWEATVSAIRAKQKPLYWVECLSGGTIDVLTSREAALKCKAEMARPHLYAVFEQQAGHLWRIG
jgi:hypothetical protein